MTGADLRDIVIVGTSLAGLRAAEGLRAGGYEGRLHMVGEETVRPYNRPPLSKDLLLGKVGVDDLVFHGADAIDAQWYLGNAATGLDLSSRRILLSSGSSICYDALVVATGVEARWPQGIKPGRRSLSLRSLADAVSLSRELTRCRRLVVLGAGFIGCEVASSARGLGVEVSLVDKSPAPLARVLGAEIAQHLGALHSKHGVSAHFGAAVEEVLDGDQGLQGVQLTDGTVIEGDLMVVGIGARPAVGWLEASGVYVDNGVVCDETLRVLTTDGAIAPGVWAAGDVARWPHRSFGGELIRIEHWTNAVMSGFAVARNILNSAEPTPYLAVPEFWSDQYGINIRGVGRLDASCEVNLESGSIESAKFLVSYVKNGITVGALGFDATRELAKWRSRIGDRREDELTTR